MTKLIYILAIMVLCSCGSCKTAEGPICGGYTQFRALQEDEVKLFNDTYKGEIALTPFEVATQVVAGTNYKFRCRDNDKNIYIVVIYQPLPGQGDPETTSVTKE